MSSSCSTSEARILNFHSAQCTVGKSITNRHSPGVSSSRPMVARLRYGGPVRQKTNFFIQRGDRFRFRRFLPGLKIDLALSIKQVVKKLQQSLLNTAPHTAPYTRVTHSVSTPQTQHSHMDMQNTCDMPTSVVTHPTLQLCMARRISKLPPSAFPTCTSIAHGHTERPCAALTSPRGGTAPLTVRRQQS